jgi:phenylacetate-coenzyme A ligase PaaK-like adenylate-forming protein
MATDRAYIAALAEKRLAEFIKTRPADAKQYSIKLTSGSTAAPIISVSENLEHYFKTYSKSVSAVVGFASMNLRMANAMYARHHTTDNPRRILFLDVNDLVPGLGELLGDLAPDLIRGFPSFMVRISEHMREADMHAVKYLVFAGELFTDARVTFFKTHYPNAIVRRMYIAGEMGPISALDCGHLPCNCYHPMAGVTLTIDNPNELGIGAVLVTKTIEDGVRVEDYRIGDTARWRTEPCACGAPLAFEIMGRDGFDYIKILGTLLRVEEVERVLAPFAHRLAEYRVEAAEVSTDVGSKGQLTLRVYSPGGMTSEAADALLNTFADTLYMTPTKTLRRLIVEGIFLPPRLEQEPVSFMGPGKAFKLRFVQ